MGLEFYLSTVKEPNKRQKLEVSSEGRLGFSFVGGRKARKCLFGSMLIAFQPLREARLTDSLGGGKGREKKQSVVWAVTVSLSAQIAEQ